MTPERFVERIGQLVSQGRNRAALAFADHVELTVDPSLNFDQLDRVGGLLESAATVVSLEEADEVQAVTRGA